MWSTVRHADIHGLIIGLFGSLIYPASVHALTHVRSALSSSTGKKVSLRVPVKNSKPIRTLNQNFKLTAITTRGKEMKIWFDSEFIEDGKTIELLSLGMVREDGAEYYAVNGEADHSRADAWVKENVLPHINMLEGKPKWQIRDEVLKFCLPEGDSKPEIWAYYGAYDWVVFCQLFGRMVDLPKGFPKFCRDVKQLCVDVGNPKLPKQKSIEHHALHDARWTKTAYNFCRGIYEECRCCTGQLVDGICAHCRGWAYCHGPCKAQFCSTHQNHLREKHFETCDDRQRWLKGNLT